MGFPAVWDNAGRGANATDAIASAIAATTESLVRWYRMPAPSLVKIGTVFSSMRPQVPPVKSLH